MASADFIDWFFHSKNTSVRQKREAVGGTSSPTWTKAARSQLLQMIGPVTRSCLLLCSWKVWTDCRYSRALKPSQAKHLHEWRNVAQQSASSVLLLSAHEHELTAWGSSVAVCMQVDELLAVVTCQLQFDSHTLPVYTEGGGWSRKLWRQSYNMRFLDTYSSATITPYGKRRLPPGGERFDFAFPFTRKFCTT